MIRAFITTTFSIGSMLFSHTIKNHSKNGRRISLLKRKNAENTPSDIVVSEKNTFGRTPTQSAESQQNNKKMLIAIHRR